MTKFQKYLHALTVEQCKKCFGISERTVRYWRAGNPPSLSKLPMIRRKTGFSATEIYG